MRFTLLASALALSFAAPAFAEVSISGLISYELNYSHAPGDNNLNVINNGTQIYFRGEDKLDNGGKINWSVESYILSPDFDGKMGNRKRYIRYTDPTLGALTFGKDDTSFRAAFVPYDIFNGYATLGNLWDQNGSSRPGQLAKYVSPTLGGLTASISSNVRAYQAGEPDKGYYGALNYKLGKVAFDVAYSDERDRMDSNENIVHGMDRTNLLIAANGDLTDSLRFGLAYTHANKRADANSAWVDRNSGMGTLTYTTGKNIFRGGYTYSRAEGSEKGDQIYIVGWEYTATKSTSLYVELSHIENSANNSYALAIPVTNGQDPTTLAIGAYTAF